MPVVVVSVPCGRTPGGTASSTWPDEDRTDTDASGSRRSQVGRGDRPMRIPVPGLVQLPGKDDSRSIPGEVASRGGDGPEVQNGSGWRGAAGLPGVQGE